MTQMFPLGDISTINPRLPKELAGQSSRPVHFVPMAELSEEGYLNSNGTRRLDEVSKGYTYFENGDVLVATITPCMENGKAALVTGLKHHIGFGSTEFHVLRPSDDVDGKYLFYMIWNPMFQHAAESRMTGSAGQKRVPKSFLDRFEIPLPPMKEQERIAAILDKTDAIRRKRQHSRREMELLPLWRFLDVFGDPVNNPSGWPMAKVSELLDTIIDYRGKTPPKSTEGIPLISAANVKGGRVVFHKPTFISKKEYSVWTTRGFTQPGDVLITTEAPVGEVAAYPPKGTYLITRRVMALRPDKNRLASDFLLYCFLCPHVQVRLSAFHHGSTVPRILKPDLTNFEIPVPPIERQREFGNFVVLWRALVEKAQEGIDEADLLFNSLVQRAFRGEL